ncbi:hypothetical protein BaRGS_00028237 [Batillaria attramentaria]|uniref:C2H2-type domain-containing protein n=1 Tax=Batillaria attramentaria TaxID=370345 RepID=A0ABD0K0N9_9CAEN
MDADDVCATLTSNQADNTPEVKQEAPDLAHVSSDSLPDPGRVSMKHEPVVKCEETLGSQVHFTHAAESSGFSGLMSETADCGLVSGQSPQLLMCTGAGDKDRWNKLETQHIKQECPNFRHTGEGSTEILDTVQRSVTGRFPCNITERGYMKDSLSNMPANGSIKIKEENLVLSHSTNADGRVEEVDSDTDRIEKKAAGFELKTELKDSFTGDGEMLSRTSVTHSTDVISVKLEPLDADSSIEEGNRSMKDAAAAASDSSGVLCPVALFKNIHTSKVLPVTSSAITTSQEKLSVCNVQSFGNGAGLSSEKVLWSTNTHTVRTSIGGGGTAQNKSGLSLKCVESNDAKTARTPEGRVEKRKLGLLFVCKECGETFTALLALTSHNEDHKKQTTEAKQSLTCPKCSVVFGDHYGLLKHQTTPCGMQSLKCLLCHKVFATQSALSSHHSKTHKPWRNTFVQEYRCKVCGEVFASFKQWKIHIGKVCGEKHCRGCSKTFTTQALLKVHEDEECEESYLFSPTWKSDLVRRQYGRKRKNHTNMKYGGETFVNCSETSATQSLLKHFKDKECRESLPSLPEEETRAEGHKGYCDGKTFQCMKCAKTCRTLEALIEDHQFQLSECAAAESKQCPVCSAAFFSVYFLQHHMKNYHSDTKCIF